MIIHQAIKYLNNRYGHDILLNKRLFNLMRDFHFFDYEDSSIQSTFEIVIQCYGDELYKSLENNDWSATYSRSLMDCNYRFGFKDEIISYIFESISYGFGQIAQISKNYVHPFPDRKSRWSTYMIFYQLCGFNLIPIKGDRDNWYDNKKSFKNPAYGSWQDFKNDELRISLISDIASNKEYTGIGGILGVDNLRVLDFDDLSLFTKVVNAPWFENYGEFNDFVKYCLSLLRLPEDYHWVVRSGSGCGFHIIFRTNEITNFNPEIISFKNRKDLYKEKIDVKALDLIWNGYIALPPTSGAGAFNPNLYETYPFVYRFINCDLFPDYEPAFVSIGDLNNFLNQYCAEDHFYGGWHGGTTLYGHKKISSEFGSFTNDYLSHNDSIEWLESCNTPEGKNMAAIKYIEHSEYDKAAKILSSHFNYSFAAYNYAVLMSYGHVPFSSLLLNRLRQTFEQDTRISKYDIERLFERVEKSKSN